MELIKKIKQAESQAQEIIDQAKAEAAKQVEQGRENRRKSLEEAERQRNKAIEASVNQAREEGQKEAEVLKLEAENHRRQLRDQTGDKTAAAVDKVVGYLKG